MSFMCALCSVYHLDTDKHITCCLIGAELPSELCCTKISSHIFGLFCKLTCGGGIN